MTKSIREKKYKKNLYKNNERFKLDYKVKSFIRKLCIAIKNGKNYKSIYFKTLGFSFDEFKNHFNNLLKEKTGFTWENYGEWHTDHIIPKSKFEYKSMSDRKFKECWNLNNLQPLSKEKNLRKYNKLGV